MAFVHDYVEVRLDGRVVRALTSPAVVAANGPITFPAAGSRDALCDLIGKTVERVLVVAGERIEIVFSCGTRLLVPLDASRIAGGEAAHFSPGPGLAIEVFGA